MQLIAEVEPQEVVISSDDVNPLASYLVTSSVQGSIIEVTIEDNSTTSSQELCRNVEVELYLGWFYVLLLAVSVPNQAQSHPLCK